MNRSAFIYFYPRSSAPDDAPVAASGTRRGRGSDASGNTDKRGLAGMNTDESLFGITPISKKIIGCGFMEAVYRNSMKHETGAAMNRSAFIYFHPRSSAPDDAPVAASGTCP